MLDIIKSAQAQNGLRHNDYDRYRQYCTRRLARVRHAPSVHFTHAAAPAGGPKAGKKGGAGTFVKRELKPSDVTDVRHLHIPLMLAERAWAEAMAQKQEEDVATAAARNHLIHRLKKAVKHATALCALATERCDGVSALEAEAYAASMRGALNLELESWEPALSAFSTAKQIYEQLAQTAPRRQRDQFISRAEELAPNERYCRYNLARRQGGKSAIAAGRGGAAGGAGDELHAEISSKIAAALAEGRRAEGGEGGSGSSSGGGGVAPSSLYWRKTTLPLRSERIKGALAAATAKSRQLALLIAAAAAEQPAAAVPSSSSSSSAAAAAAASESTERAFLEVLSKYDDAIRAAQDEAGRAAKDGKAGLASDYRGVEEAVTFAKLRHALDNNARAIRGATDALDAAEAAAAAGAGALMSDATAATAAALISTTGGPWQAALSAARPTSSGADASATLARKAIAAAVAVAAWYARVIKTLDEMTSLCGGGEGAQATAVAGATGNAAASSAAAADGTGAAGAGSLPRDDALIGSLAARRLHALALRAWFVAQSYVHAKQYSEANAMLARVSERATAALEAYKGVAAAATAASAVSAGAALPSSPLPCTSEEPGYASFVVLAGVSASHTEELSALQSRTSRARVALRATALLEILAPRARSDADLAAAYASGFGGTAPAGIRGAPIAPAALVRSSSRPTQLTERMAAGAAAAGGGGGGVAVGLPVAMEPSDDANVVAAWPLVPLAMPMRSIVFDIAFNGVEYPSPPEPAAHAHAAVAGGSSKVAASVTPVKAAAVAATPGKTATAAVGPTARVGPGGSPASVRVGPSSSVKSPTAAAVAAGAASPAAAPAASAAGDEGGSPGGSGLLSWLVGR